MYYQLKRIHCRIGRVNCVRKTSCLLALSIHLKINLEYFELVLMVTKSYHPGQSLFSRVFFFNLAHSAFFYHIEKLWDDKKKCKIVEHQKIDDCHKNEWTIEKSHGKQLCFFLGFSLTLPLFLHLCWPPNHLV